MPNRFRRFSALLVSLVLALSLVPASAFATDPQAPADDRQQTLDAQMAVDAQGQEVDSAEQQEPTDDIQSDAPVEHATSALVQVQSADVIEYVFIESPVLAVGQEQKIAVVFKDESMSLVSAKITLVGNESMELAIDASLVEGNAAVFGRLFSEQEQASYSVSKIEYATPDGSYLIDFTQALDESASDVEADVDAEDVEKVTMTSDRSGMSFEVVSEQLANALESTEDSDLTAMVLNDDGGIVATDNVEEALSIASAAVDEGISVASARSSAREEHLIVAIDPGHGGHDPGACGSGLEEATLNLKIARHMRDELQTYAGVTVYMTRDSDTYLGLSERVYNAHGAGADVFVSIHINSGGGTGIEVWVPNTSPYDAGVRDEARTLGQRICDQLAALGLVSRGIKTSNSANGSTYPDGSTADYLTVISTSRRMGIPGVLAEHLFIDRAEDNAKLKSDEWLRKMGVADATAVASQYGLSRDSDVRSQSLVQIEAHVTNLGWQRPVYDGMFAGTSGKSMTLQAIKINAINDAASNGGGISYRANVNGNWQDWVSNGAQAGTVGQNLPLKAVELKLTGSAAVRYDVLYRVHVSNIGWMDWVKNGETAGYIANSNNVEAIEVKLVKRSDVPSVAYQTHVQDIGWQDAKYNGDMAGTSGQAKRLEGIRISIEGGKYSGGISYKTQIQDIGWETDSKTNGAMSGTEGRGLRLETISINLTGEIAKHYDVYYRVHCQDFGWMGWAKNGEHAGSAGCCKRLEGIEVMLVEKSNTSSVPSPLGNAAFEPPLTYSAHVQDLGWRPESYNGSECGTTGSAKRMEGFTLKLNGACVDRTGGIAYSAHVQDIGWQNEVADGALCGTEGRSYRLEALKIRLTGSIANYYDVYYCVHAESIGWMGWAKNGEPAGTEGKALRLEAVKVMLVPKDGVGPSSSAPAFEKS